MKVCRSREPVTGIKGPPCHSNCREFSAPSATSPLPHTPGCSPDSCFSIQIHDVRMSLGALKSIIWLKRDPWHYLRAERHCRSTLGNNHVRRDTDTRCWRLGAKSR